MPNLPKQILNALFTNSTSLGDHPAFPPEDEEKFIVKAVSSVFNELANDIVGDFTEKSLKQELGRLVATAIKLEQKYHTQLEKLCVEVISKLLNIPENSITIDCKLVNEVNTDNERLIPEKNTDYKFDSISDINNITDEIYKRRMLNALVTGAAMYYASDVMYYISDVFKINDQLPSLYKRILQYNNILSFIEIPSLDKEKCGGKVDVVISSKTESPLIKSEAVLFPILIEETIKGILELAVSHGLPKERSKAEYVIKKADFRLAEVWDMKLGYTLWSIIEKQIAEMGFQTIDIGINFILMEIAEMDCEKFNEVLQEIFASTKRGSEYLYDIIDKINIGREKEEFDEYIKTMNTNNSTDDTYFTAEELIMDCKNT